MQRHVFSHAPFKPYLSVRRGQLWKPTVWDRHCGCVRPGTLIPVPTLSVSPQCRKKKTGDIRWQFVIWKAQDDIGKDWLSRILANCLWFARRRSLLWEHVMYTCITNELFFIGESMVCFPLSTARSGRAFAKLGWPAASYLTRGHWSFGMLRRVLFRRFIRFGQLSFVVFFGVCRASSWKCKMFFVTVASASHKSGLSWVVWNADNGGHPDIDIHQHLWCSWKRHHVLKNTKSSLRSVLDGLVYWVIEPSTIKRHAKNSRRCFKLPHSTTGPSQLVTSVESQWIPDCDGRGRHSVSFSLEALIDVASGMTLFGNDGTVETWCARCAVLRLGLHLRVPDTRSSQRLHQVRARGWRSAGNKDLDVYLVRCAGKAISSYLRAAAPAADPGRMVNEWNQIGINILRCFVLLGFPLFHMYIFMKYIW